MRRPHSSEVRELRAQTRGSRPWGDSLARGYSLAELLVVLTVVSIVLAVGVPVFERAADVADAAAAARYMSGIVARARFDAARQQRARALRFDAGPPVSFSLASDGDGDGVNASDVTAGVDPVIRGPDRLDQRFPRARFGIGDEVQAIDEARTLSAADDPIRLGTANQLTLGPLGTATSGTIYIVSRAGVQFAVRIAGITGRARVLRYIAGERTWRPY